MCKKSVLFGSILIFTAIILGAMGAHSLEPLLGEKLMHSFEKGVQYQFYAGFSLLIIGLAQDKFSFNLRWFKTLMLSGVFLFSGFIYGYCFHPLMPTLKPLVYVVPIGGTLMIAAWLVFIIQFIRSK